MSMTVEKLAEELYKAAHGSEADSRPFHRLIQAARDYFSRPAARALELLMPKLANIRVDTETELKEVGTLIDDHDPTTWPKAGDFILTVFLDIDGKFAGLHFGPVEQDGDILSIENDFFCTPLNCEGHTLHEAWEVVWFPLFQKGAAQ